MIETQVTSVAQADADGNAIAGTVQSLGEDGSVTIRGEHGTLTINSDGSYTYTVDANDRTVLALTEDSEPLSDVFSYTLTDGDGDTSSTTLTITINGSTSTPTAVVADKLIVDEAALTGTTYQGSGTAAPESKQDEVGDAYTIGTEAYGTLTVTAGEGLSSITVTVGGTDLVINWDDTGFSDGTTTSYTLTGNNTLQGSYGTVTVTGLEKSADSETYTLSYTYTLTKPVEAGTSGTGRNTVTDRDTFTVTVKDQHGNSTPSEVKVEIVDDVCRAVDDVQETVVTEAADSVSGDVLANDTQGADGATVSAVAQADADGNAVDANGKAITSEGRKTQVSQDGETTVEGLYGTLHIKADGSYTYELDRSNLDVRRLTDDQTLTERFTYTLKDSDNDISTATLTLTIEGADNEVTVKPADGQERVTVYESLLPDGTENTSTTGENQSVFTGSLVISAPDILGGVFVAANDGTAVQIVTVDENNTPSLVSGSTTIETASGTLEITNVSVNKDGTYSIEYTYTLSDSLTHKDSGGSLLETLEGVDKFVFTASDQDTNTDDTDSGSYTLYVDVVDDAPKARADTNSVTENGPTAVVTTSGNVLDGGVSDGDNPDRKGADHSTDSPTLVTGVKPSGSESTGFSAVSEPEEGAEDTGTTVEGTYGTLTIHSDGSYTYTLNSANREVQALGEDSTPLEDVFDYQITDADGDTASTTLTISINGTDDKPTLTPSDDKLIVDEAYLAEDTESGQHEGSLHADATETEIAAQTTTSGSMTIAAEDGLLSLTVTGAGTSSVSYTYAVDADGNFTAGDFVGQTVTCQYGTLKITGLTPNTDDEGKFDGTYTLSYTYTLTSSMDSGTDANEPRNTVSEGDSFTVSVLDQNDDPTDPVTQKVSIAIIDDVPTAEDDYAGTVTEATVTATGNVITGETAQDDGQGRADTAGADTASVTSYSWSTTSDDTTTTSSADAGHTLTGHYGTLTIDAQGNYTYTLNTNNSTVRRLGDKDTLTETFSYTLTDADGDTDTAELSFTIQGTDYGVTITEGSKTLTVYESGLSDGSDPTSETHKASTTGTLVIEAKDILEDLYVAVNSTEESAYQQIATVSEEGGITIPDAAKAIQAANGVLTVNSLVYNNDGTYTLTYTYTLSDNMGSSTDAASVTEYLNADVFHFFGTDHDGDSSGNWTVTVTVVDDVPEARTDYNSVTETGLDAAVCEGNVITGVRGSGDSAVTVEDSADTKGADDAFVTAIESVNVPTNSSSDKVDDSNVSYLEIDGQYGTLKIYADGTYTYTVDPTNREVLKLKDSDDTLTETFTYTLTDTDNDASQADLVITIGGSDNAIEIADIPLEVDEASLAKGSQVLDEYNSESYTDEYGTETWQTVSATDTSHATITVPDGLDTLTISGADGSSWSISWDALSFDENGLYTLPANTVVTSDAGELLIKSIQKTGNESYMVNYTYTLKENIASGTGDVDRNTVNKGDSFTIWVKDQDGTEQDGTINVNIIDDVPIANDDANSVTENEPGAEYVTAEGNVITGEGSTLGKETSADVQGADSASVSSYAVVTTDESGKETVGTPVSVGTQIEGQYGWLTINEDGSYTYTLDRDNRYVQALEDNATLQDVFQYTLEDGDGDTASAKLTITINGTSHDDVAVGGSTVTVDEANLTDGSGTDDPDGYETEITASATGTLIITARDGISTVTVTEYTSLASADGSTITTLTSNNVLLSIDASGNVISYGSVETAHGTLTATKIEVNPNDSNSYILTYTYTLDASTQQHSSDEGRDTLNGAYVFTVEAKDQDGTNDTGTITVDILDDVPTVTNKVKVQLYVDESSLTSDGLSDAEGIASFVTITPGADGLASATYTLGYTEPADAVTNYALDANNTWQPITISVVDGQIVGSIATSTTPAFTISVDADGLVTFTQYLAIRHGDPNSNNDGVTINGFTVTASVTDNDGDTASAMQGFEIKIADDGPYVQANRTGVGSNELYGNLKTLYFGTDQAWNPESGNQIVENGAAMTIKVEETLADGTERTITFKGTLNEDGTWTFTSDTDGYSFELDSATNNFVYTRPDRTVDGQNIQKAELEIIIMDGDGDTARASISQTWPDSLTIDRQIVESGVQGHNASNPNAPVSGTASVTGNVKVVDSDGDSVSLSLTSATLSRSGSTDDTLDVSDVSVSMDAVALGTNGSAVLYLVLNSDGSYKLTADTPSATDSVYCTLNLSYANNSLNYTFSLNEATGNAVDRLIEGEQINLSVNLSLDDGLAVNSGILLLDIKGTNDQPLFSTTYATTGDTTVEVADPNAEGAFTASDESAGSIAPTTISGLVTATDQDADNGSGSADNDDNGLTFTLTGGFSSTAGTVSTDTDGNVTGYNAYEDGTERSNVLSSVSKGVTQGDGTTTIVTTYGTLILNEDGSWTYTANDTDIIDRDEYVTETFTIQVTDEHGSYSTQTITITLRDEENEGTVVKSETQHLKEAGVWGSDTGYTSDASTVVTRPDDVNANTELAGDASVSGSLFEDTDLNEQLTVGVGGLSLVWTDASAEEGTVPTSYTAALDTSSLVLEYSGGADAVAYVQVTGSEEAGWTFTLTSEQPADADCAGTLTLSRDSEGTVSWTFDLNDACTFVNQLAQDDTVDVSFDLTISEEHGGKHDASISFVIEGTNDAPTLTATNLGSLTAAAREEAAEEDFEAQTLTGQATGSDADHDAVLTYTFCQSEGASGGAWVTATLNGVAVEDNASAESITTRTYDNGQQTLEIDTDYGVIEIDLTTGEYTYTLDKPATDEDGNANAVLALGEGDTLVETFYVQVTDENGSWSTQAITVTINGTNDRPVVDETSITLHATEGPYTDGDSHFGHTDGSGNAVAYDTGSVKAVDYDGDSLTYVFAKSTEDAENPEASSDRRTTTLDLTAERVLLLLSVDPETYNNYYAYTLDENGNKVYVYEEDANGNLVKKLGETTQSILDALTALGDTVISTLTLNDDGSITYDLAQDNAFATQLNDNDFFSVSLSEYIDKNGDPFQVYAYDGEKASLTKVDINLAVHGQTDPITSQTSVLTVKEEGVWTVDPTDPTTTEETTEAEGTIESDKGYHYTEASGTFTLSSQDSGLFTFWSRNVDSGEYQERGTQTAVEVVEAQGDTGNECYVRGLYGYWVIDLDATVTTDDSGSIVRTFSYTYRLYTDLDPVEDAVEIEKMRMYWGETKDSLPEEGSSSVTIMDNVTYLNYLINTLAEGDTITDTRDVKVVLGASGEEYEFTLTSVTKGTNDRPEIYDVTEYGDGSLKVYSASEGEDALRMAMLENGGQSIMVVSWDRESVVGEAIPSSVELRIIDGSAENNNYSGVFKSQDIDGTYEVNQTSNFSVDLGQTGFWTNVETDAEGNMEVESEIGYLLVNKDGTFTFHLYDVEMLSTLSKGETMTLDAVTIYSIDDLHAQSEGVTLNIVLYGTDYETTVGTATSTFYEGVQQGLTDMISIPDSASYLQTYDAAHANKSLSGTLTGSIAITDTDRNDLITEVYLTAGGLGTDDGTDYVLYIHYDMDEDTGARKFSHITVGLASEDASELTSNTVYGTYGKFVFTSLEDGQLSYTYTLYTEADGDYYNAEVMQALYDRIDALNEGETLTLRSMQITGVKTGLNMNNNTDWSEDVSADWTVTEFTSGGTITITVTGTNDAPVIDEATDESGNNALEEDGSVSITVNSSRLYATGHLSASDVDDNDTAGSEDYDLSWGILCEVTVTYDENGDFVSESARVVYVKTDENGVQHSYYMDSGEKLTETQMANLTLRSEVSLEHGILICTADGTIRYVRNSRYDTMGVEEGGSAYEHVYVTVLDSHDAADSILVNIEVKRGESLGGVNPTAVLTDIVMNNKEEPDKVSVGSDVVTGYVVVTMYVLDDGGGYYTALYQDDAGNWCRLSYDAEGNAVYTPIGEDEEPIAVVGHYDTDTQQIVFQIQGEGEEISVPVTQVDAFPQIDYHFKLEDGSLVNSVQTEYGVVYINETTGEIRFVFNSGVDTLDAYEHWSKTLQVVIEADPDTTKDRFLNISHGKGEMTLLSS